MPAPKLLTCLCLLSCLACAPVRTMPAGTCTSSAHCPAGGTHYCDLVSGTCKPCNGACPGVGAPSNDTGPADIAAGFTEDDVSGGVDAASAETSGDGAGSTDATTADGAGQSCKGLCGSELANCGCDDSCTEFGDCCPDFTTYCPVEADAGANEQ